MPVAHSRQSTVGNQTGWNWNGICLTSTTPHHFPPANPWQALHCRYHCCQASLKTKFGLGGDSRRLQLLRTFLAHMSNLVLFFFFGVFFLLFCIGFWHSVGARKCFYMMKGFIWFGWFAIFLVSPPVTLVVLVVGQLNVDVCLYGSTASDSM